MRVHIPSGLRRWTGGRDMIELPLAADRRMTAAEVIEALAREHPGSATACSTSRASFAAT